MLKRLVKHGNSKAIIINKELLKKAGITDKTLFRVTVIESGKLLINPVSLDSDEYEKYSTILEDLVST